MPKWAQNIFLIRIKLCENNLITKSFEDTVFIGMVNKIFLRIFNKKAGVSENVKN